MRTVRLTAAQATVRFLAAQKVEIDGRRQRLFEGVLAIFGHGNVAGLGEALYAERDSLPTYRAHNEQAMAHAAIAFAKASRRRRMMACTTSIGPGATNMVTAAAVAHVNRLPVLLIPGDVFANRRPDPVLQQVEDFGDGTVTANDCFRPVSRYFDRILRPEQIVPALNRAVAVLTDPAECGPVTLAFCQDVQTEAYDYPEIVFRGTGASAAPHRARSARGRRGRRVAHPGEKAARHLRRRRALFRRRAHARRLLRAARRSGRRDAGRQVGDAWSIIRWRWARSASPAPARPTRWPRKRTSSSASARGSPDFTTGSWALFKNPGRRFIGINVQPFDAAKHRALAGRRRRAKSRSPRSMRRSAILEGAGRLGRGGGEGEGRVGDDCRPLHRADQHAAAVRRAGDRRAHARGRDERRRRLRGGRPAGRTAQAMASRRSARLSRRIRLFLHGLRDRRRHRRQDGAARPRGRRDGRRRLLSDDELRDRDLGDAGPEAHHRRARQSRLRLHQPAAAMRRAARRSTIS